MRFPFSKKPSKTSPARGAPAMNPARAQRELFLDSLLLKAWHREGRDGAPEGSALRSLLEQPRSAHLRALLTSPEELARFILDWLKAGPRAATPEGQSTEFCEFFQVIQLTLAMNDRELSLHLHTAPATVAQWASGTGAPHPLAREGILFRLAKVAQKRFP